LPDFLKQKIQKSKEYQTMVSPEIKHFDEVQQKLSDWQVPDKEDLEPLPF
jgi:hypothetical protein